MPPPVQGDVPDLFSSDEEEEQFHRNPPVGDLEGRYLKRSRTRIRSQFVLTPLRIGLVNLADEFSESSEDEEDADEERDPIAVGIPVVAGQVGLEFDGAWFDGACNAKDSF